MSEQNNQSLETLKICPAVDIAFEKKGIRLYADMPGVDAATIDISMEKDEISIRGKIGSNREVGTARAGLKLEGYSRSFRIPADIDGDAIEAEYKDGVLRLFLPKAEKALPKKIKLIDAA